MFSKCQKLFYLKKILIIWVGSIASAILSFFSWVQKKLFVSFQKAARGDPSWPNYNVNINFHKTQRKNINISLMFLFSWLQHKHQMWFSCLETNTPISLSGVPRKDATSRQFFVLSDEMRLFWLVFRIYNIWHAADFCFQGIILDSRIWWYNSNCTLQNTEMATQYVFLKVWEP